jgi:hypothetical protein
MKRSATTTVVRFGLSRRRRDECCGITLIEILVVAALASIVMGVVVSVFVAILKQDRKVRRFAVEGERQFDLAESIRTDIRSASEVSLAAQTVLLIIAPNERETRYELTAGGCRRIVAKPGVDKPRVDFFAVGPAVAWSLKQGPSGRLPLYIASLHRRVASDKNQSPAMPFFVYAALGADLPGK